MKRIDYLIIGFVVIVGAILYLCMMREKTVTNTYQIIVKNQVVDEDYIYNKNNYLIESSNGYIYIYKNDSLLIKILNKDIIKNEIEVCNNVIKMKNANCSGKDCTFMIIDSNHKMPIICTNGVVIKLVNRQTNSDIVS